MENGTVISPDNRGNEVREAGSTAWSRMGHFALGRPSRWPLDEIVACRPADGAVSAVHLTRFPSGVQVERILLTNDEAPPGVSEGSTRPARLPKRCPLVALLPRSTYLLKVLEVPDVGPEEIPAMLGLEVEALLPPEFGSVELSYRQLPSDKEGCRKYEVYIARRDDLSDYLSSLAGLGVTPDLVLPSAAVWAGMFDLNDRPDLIAAPVDSDSLEIVSFLADRAVAVRTIDTNCGLERGLVEFIRPFLAHSAAGRPMIIGWVGNHCPAHLANDRITFKNADYLIPQQAVTGPGKAENDAFLCFSAAVLLDVKSEEALHTSNMLPKALMARRRTRAVYGRMAVAVMSVLLTLLAVFAAAKIATLRYKHAAAALSGRIALIKTEGEAVGRRIEQLRAIHAAGATRNDFFDILAGLYQATSDGVTYSHVELTDAGVIHLRGQAKSLSLPFLLPERLEKQTVFEQVLLRDAGQSKRAGGTITEFRIDGKLHRAEDP